jgi:hypothetical protein
MDEPFIGNTFLIGAPDPGLYSLTDGIVRPDGNIPLEDAIKLAAQDPLWANRGRAIQAYAQLEQSLCAFLSNVGDMTIQVAGMIFFKVASSDARNSILEKLLHAKHGSKFNAFWNSYRKELRVIDLKRNEIVHWLSATNVALNTDNVLIVGVTLVPPNFWANLPSSQRITSEDLKDFSIKSDVFSRLLTMFSHAISPGPNVPAVEPSWLEICQQPVIYPLPPAHPLSPKPKAPEPPPRPSPA